MPKKKKTAKPADGGFLTTAAQAIGSTLGQLAKKTGVATPPPVVRKKAAVKKKPAASRAPAKRK